MMFYIDLAIAKRGQADKCSFDLARSGRRILPQLASSDRLIARCTYRLNLRTIKRDNFKHNYLCASIMSPA